MVPAQGFEPWTIGLKDRCSNQAELRRLSEIVPPRPTFTPEVDVVSTGDGWKVPVTPA